MKTTIPTLQDLTGDELDAYCRDSAKNCASMRANREVALVGTDGTRPVVWGLGSTISKAFADARRNDDFSSDDTIGFVVVDAERAKLIRQGCVSAEDFVEVRRGSPQIAKGVDAYYFDWAVSL